MKELTIEQKANRYDEVVNEIKRLRDILLKEGVINENGIICDNFNRIFPELNETDGKKTRKEILDYIIKGSESFYDVQQYGKEKFKKWIAWLEKQGESKSYWKPTEEQLEALVYVYNCCSDIESGNYYKSVLGTLIEDLHRLDDQHPKFKVGDIVQYITDSTDRRKIEEVDTLCNMYHTDSSPIMFEIADEWKVVVNAEDVEQNPTDKIEPKFKVGDWIIQEYVGVYKVIEICKSWYEVIDAENKHYSIGFDKEYMCHLWTIEDAKDGDVLYHETKGGVKYIVMNKGLNEHGNINSYFRYNSLDGFGVDIPAVLSTRLDGITPATKEQRDLLFQKMKEAGYEWDGEHKKLTAI